MTRRAQKELGDLQETVAVAIILLQQGQIWPALNLLRESIPDPPEPPDLVADQFDGKPAEDESA